MIDRRGAPYLFKRAQRATRVSLEHHSRPVRKNSIWAMSRDESGGGRHHPLHDGAVLGIALALLLDSLIGQAASLLLFFGVVAAHAWSGGMRPRLLAATLVALVANHFLLPESHGRSITHPIALALLLRVRPRGDPRRYAVLRTV